MNGILERKFDFVKYIVHKCREMARVPANV